MSDSDDSDENYLVASQASVFGAHGWTQLRNGASTSQESQNRGASNSQRPQNRGVPTSQRSQNIGSSSQRSRRHNVASSNRNSQDRETASGSQRYRASDQEPQNRGVPTNSTDGSLRNLLEDFVASVQQANQRKEKKPKPRANLKCQLCPKVLANPTTLFRHYKGMHNELNPERFGFTVNTTPVNVDDSMSEDHYCPICAFKAANKHALDAHVAAMHSRDSRERCQASINVLDNNVRSHVNNGSENNNSSGNNHGGRNNSSGNNNGSGNNNTSGNQNDGGNNNSSGNNNGSGNISSSGNNCGGGNNSTSGNSKGSENICSNGNSNGRGNICSSGNNNAVDTFNGVMYKCGQCPCYFDSKNELDKHLKEVHRFGFPCIICHQNFRFQDLNNHVRDNHPEVFNEGDGTLPSNVIVENNVRTQRRTRVFKCRRCPERFASKEKALGHMKRHKKELRGRYINRCNRRTPLFTHIIYICKHCKVATNSYDVALDHSQKHLCNPDEEFPTLKCPICSLKFGKMCYENHKDVNCKDKKSIKFVEYEYNMLLTDDWLKFFDIDELLVRQNVSNSIYAHTRAVKMKVVSGKSNTITLYQCKQCDSFVEPSEVRTHTVVCTRIPTNFICNFCERCFDTESALKNHVAVHAKMNNNDCFRIVMFNDERDREFNYILNHVTLINSQVANVIEKVIYRCDSCRICFISEVAANNHIKNCPGQIEKKNCRICDNLFDVNEYVEHCYDHSCSKIQLKVKNVVPEAIVISDDEDETNNIVYCVSDDDEQNDGSAERSTIQSNPSVATENASGDVPMDEDDRDASTSDHDEKSDHSNFEASHDEDSQSTLINGEYCNVQDIGNAPRTCEIKCVDPNLLLNPCYKSDTIVEAVERNENFAVKIESTTQNVAFDLARVKEENTCEEDNKMNRESNVPKTVAIVELTDDEDEATEPNPVNESDFNAHTHFHTSNLTLPSPNAAHNLENGNVARTLRNLQNTMVPCPNLLNGNGADYTDGTVRRNVIQRIEATTMNLNGIPRFEGNMIVGDEIPRCGAHTVRSDEAPIIGGNMMRRRFGTSTIRELQRSGRNNTMVETSVLINNFDLLLSDERNISNPNCSIC